VTSMLSLESQTHDDMQLFKKSVYAGTLGPIFITNSKKDKKGGPSFPFFSEYKESVAAKKVGQSPVIRELFVG